MIGLTYIVSNTNKSNAYLIKVFNGIWTLAFVLLLLFQREVIITYCTPFSFFLIGIHFLFFNFGYILNTSKYFLNSKKIKISLKQAYFISLSLSLLGIILISYNINLVEYLVQQQIAKLRSDGFEGNVTTNGALKMLANFIYPFSIVSGLYYFEKKKVFVFVPFILLATFFSLLNGGKGSMIILSSLFMGSLIYKHNLKQINIDKKLKYSILILFVLIIIYFIYITYSRNISQEGDLVYLDIFEEIFKYFCYSIPAFSQWLEINKLSLLNFDISQVSLIREISNLFGYQIPRLIDKQIVYIPEQFNVFTAFADSISAFGIFGSVVYYFLIGILLKFVDKSREVSKQPFLYCVLFLFSIQSLFSDVFFFMIGVWICLFIHFFIKIEFKTIQFE